MSLELQKATRAWKTTIKGDKTKLTLLIKVIQ